MEYCKDTTKEYLLAIAENIAGTMLVDEDGEYKNVTPFNCHMLFLCIGTYITVDMDRTDILRLNLVQKRVLTGTDLSIEFVTGFIRNDPVYRNFKYTVTGSNDEWDTGDYPALFDFISKVNNGKIFIAGNLDKLDVNEIKSLWQDLDSIVTDKFTHAIILQHVNALYSFIENKEKFIDSILCYCVSSSFEYIASRYDDIRISLETLTSLEEGKAFRDEQKELIGFMYSNPKGSLLKQCVPIVSDVLLDKLFGQFCKRSNSASQFVEDTSIGDELKKSISDYIANGGNPGKLIAYINSIS